MADPGESRRFEEIVAHLNDDVPPPRPRSRGRLSLAAGVVLCLVAVALITLGGVKGAVIAVIPWILGIVVVVRSRAWL